MAYNGRRCGVGGSAWTALAGCLGGGAAERWIPLMAGRREKKRTGCGRRGRIGWRVIVHFARAASLWTGAGRVRVGVLRRVKSDALAAVSE